MVCVYVYFTLCCLFFLLLNKRALYALSINTVSNDEEYKWIYTCNRIVEYLPSTYIIIPTYLRIEIFYIYIHICNVALYSLTYIIYLYSFVYIYITYIYYTYLGIIKKNHMTWVCMNIWVLSHLLSQIFSRYIILV